MKVASIKKKQIVMKNVVYKRGDEANIHLIKDQTCIVTAKYQSYNDKSEVAVFIDGDATIILNFKTTIATYISSTEHKQFEFRIYDTHSNPVLQSAEGLCRTSKVKENVFVPVVVGDTLVNSYYGREYTVAFICHDNSLILERTNRNGVPQVIVLRANDVDLNKALKVEWHD